MRRILGWPVHPLLPQMVGVADMDSNSPPAALSVHDLIPARVRDLHRQNFAASVKTGKLPDSLSHPLRGVYLLRTDGEEVRVNVGIGLITKVCWLHLHVSFAELKANECENC